MGGLLYLVQRRRDWPGPLLAVPNVTAHPPTASVPITVLQYSGLLLCGFYRAMRMHKRGICRHPVSVRQVRGSRQNE